MIKKQTITGALAAIANTARKNSSGRLQMRLAVGICLVGVLLTFVLVKLRKPPQRTEQENVAPLVKVRELNVRDIQMVVSGYGTVTPKVQVEIVPQVSGKVVSVNPQFKSGGFIRADEQLLKIDPRDYELAVRQAEAVVAEAEVAMDLEEAEAQVARKEWEQLHPNTEPASPLVLRRPQIRQAEAKLESAKAQLESAKLNLERTRLSLPFDVRIISETVDLGQYVVVGGNLGTAYGIDAVEIELPLEDRDLAWFDIPDGMVSFNGGRLSSKAVTAQVKADFAGANHTWQGYVTRTTGQVDKTSRLISVVIEVEQPFNISNGRPALLPGIFVEVFIKGNVLKNAVAVPRDAIHNGNEVWIVKEGRLHIQTLEIVRTDKNFAYVTSDIESGTMIVTSSLDVVTEGMSVRIKKQTELQRHKTQRD